MACFWNKNGKLYPRRPAGEVFPEIESESLDFKRGYARAARDIYEEALIFLNHDKEFLIELGGLIEEVLPSEVVERWLS